MRSRRSAGRRQLRWAARDLIDEHEQRGRVRLVCCRGWVERREKTARRNRAVRQGNEWSPFCTRPVPGSHRTISIVPGWHTTTALVHMQNDQQQGPEPRSTRLFVGRLSPARTDPARTVQLTAGVARLLPLRFLLTTAQPGVTTDARRASMRQPEVNFDGGTYERGINEVRRRTFKSLDH